ncbi:flagellar brake protein [Candidatus Enterovibrio escicola]|uniref:flagellar brake protein n=1 Tax=Candidatus Enterovibrio escicola TaxID=1927127 RepID=UPI0012381B1C|nr:flagellar brake protein [Candidatus Enterovibrio escacola]
MNTNAITAKKSLVRVKEKIVMGLKVMDFIQHGTESSLEIVTPLGQRLNFKSNFIGFDEHQHIFFTMPLLSRAEYVEFFMEGFNVNIEGISEQGEGALVRFRTRIEHIIYKPINLLVFTVPQQAKLVLLRNETRYELQLQGNIQLSNRKLRVVLTNVSSGGCGYSYEAISPDFDIDQRIVLEVINSTNKNAYALSGIVRNGKKKLGKQTYGIVYDDPGQVNCRRLLSALMYDGTKYVFINPKQNPALAGL